MNPEAVLDNVNWNTRNPVFSVFGNSLVDEDRVLYPLIDSEHDFLNTRLKALKDPNEPSSVVVMVDGAFDVPHDNHDWYLRHCRMLGAVSSLERVSRSVNIDSIAQAVASTAVSLVVTVDADSKISRKKGGLLEKGGVSRPIYPWQTRAGRIANMTFRGQDGALRSVVDLVTVEGDDRHVGSPLESSLSLACHMRDMNILDGLIMFGEHDETINTAVGLGLEPIIIPQHTDYAVDPRTGLAWSSSDIIRRAQGKS